MTGARVRYRPPSMVLTWNGWLSILNWYISSATRWTRRAMPNHGRMSLVRAEL